MEILRRNVRNEEKVLGRNFKRHLSLPTKDMANAQKNNSIAIRNSMIERLYSHKMVLKSQKTSVIQDEDDENFMDKFIAHPDLMDSKVSLKSKFS